MNHFCLVTNIAKDPELAVSNRIIDYIRLRGGTASVIEHGDVVPEDIPKGVECIFVLGGDGTLIRTATRLHSLDIPFVGVNLGTLGYLCELDEASFLGAIEQLLNNDYSIEERMMLTSSSDQVLALNDAVFQSGGEQKFIHLTVYVNGTRLNTYHADGIIVSTPTGSTGYSLSAGGPIVTPSAKMILLTPINDHHLGSKSIVLSASDEIEVELNSRRVEQDEVADVLFDGDVVNTLHVGERYQIKKSVAVVKILRLSKISFLENLRRKMEQ